MIEDFAMAMEKNGAVSSETPGCAGIFGTKQAADGSVRFPQTEKEADACDRDLTKDAAELVAEQSRRKSS